MSVGDSAPVHRLAFITEESLRLCSLPGEQEGRVYYFRRLHIIGLPENGDRRCWLDSFQDALGTQAASSVHGAHPAAHHAAAVFFHNEQEACELLLAAIVDRRTPGAWFWPHISGLPAESPPAAQAMAVIERLLATQASWSAVAAAVFSTIRRTNSVALLKLLPPEALAAWLRVPFADRLSASPAPVRFPEPMARAIRQAVDSFGPDAAPVSWLATLAIIALSPSLAGSETAVQIARASLRAMLPASIPPTSHTAIEPPLSGPPEIKEILRTASSAVEDHSTKEQTSASAGSEVEQIVPQNAEPPREEICFGEPTSGAGLYFLLNVLTRLRIADDPHFSLLFLARLFLHVARHAGITEDDPILLWAEIVEAQCEPQETDDRLLRLWLIKIRRWCWRNGRITVREIVRRRGYVTLTRTDLDVSLSMDSADIRIRRIGLDLDPGWVPWFGRVVRFHYRYRGEFA